MMWDMEASTRTTDPREGSAYTISGSDGGITANSRGGKSTRLRCRLQQLMLP